MAQEKVKLSADAITEYLIFGYVQNIQITKQIIPESIIFLCIEFYKSKLKIYCIAQNGGNQTKEYPNIYIAEIDSNIHYQCNIQTLIHFNPNNTKILNY